MKFSFSIEETYKSELSKDKIIELIQSNNAEKKFGGLKIIKYRYVINDSFFEVQKYANGLDALIEKFPLIKGQISSENPTLVTLRIIPNYFSIIFFSIFVFIFIPASILIQKMTINDVYRIPTVTERILIAFLGGVIPATWCYFQQIRPIKKTEKWIADKLSLSAL